MAMAIKKVKDVVVVYFGDGASSEGDCHEAMNFASVFQAPVIFICSNNQYAISVPIEKQMRQETVAQRAIAYGMPGIRVDGNDVLATYVAAKEAIDRARAGGGPSLIEGLTYRLTPHTTADDPKRYRSDAECATWNAKEPLKRFKKYLINKGIWTEEEDAALEKALDAEIKAAAQSADALAKSEYSNPLSMFDHLYKEIPPSLQAQRDELAQHLDKHKKVAKTKPDATTADVARAVE
jgi:pyruvate dehydrogenase E1 component alpha subunit